MMTNKPLRAATKTPPAFFLLNTPTSRPQRDPIAFAAALEVLG
jgi:hypothetical protein